MGFRSLCITPQSGLVYEIWSDMILLFSRLLMSYHLTDIMRAIRRENEGRKPYQRERNRPYIPEIGMFERSTDIVFLSSRRTANWKAMNVIKTHTCLTHRELSLEVKKLKVVVSMTMLEALAASPSVLHQHQSSNEEPRNRGIEKKKREWTKEIKSWSWKERYKKN